MSFRVAIGAVARIFFSTEAKETSTEGLEVRNPQSRESVEVLGEGEAATFPPARESGERYILPSGVRGGDNGVGTNFGVGVGEARPEPISRERGWDSWPSPPDRGFAEAL